MKNNSYKQSKNNMKRKTTKEQNLTQSKGFTRRSFLKLFFFSLILGIGGFLYIKRKTSIYSYKLSNDKNPYKEDKTAPKGILLSDQMKNLAELAVVVIPWKNGASIVRDLTYEYVEARCKYEDGVRKLYESTSNLLDDRAFSHSHIKRFFNLNDDQKLSIIKEMMGPVAGSQKGLKYYYNRIFRYGELRVTNFAVNDILINFYRNDQSLNYLQKG